MEQKNQYLTKKNQKNWMEAFSFINN